jgi:hypothetical protein
LSGNDKGIIVGFQVKSGESFFGKLLDDPVDGKGWFFYERNRKHLEYWLKHAVPIVVVLHHPKSKVSYWAHVIEANVRYTPKGWKIAVYEKNTLSSEGLNALMQVAASARGSFGFEGSAWNEASILGLADHQWRSALIVPRLIAPHPNASVSTELSPAQGVALVVQARQLDLYRFAERFSSIPKMSDASAHIEWGWRLASSVFSFLVGQPDVPEELLATAPDGQSRAAAAALRICALHRADENSEADIFAKKFLAANQDLDPADTAWIMIQHARVLLALGKKDEVRNRAFDAQAVVVGEPPDPTISAFIGASYWLLWTTASWSDRTFVKDVIIGGDTANSWWKDQRVAYALSDYLDQSFNAWGESKSIAFQSSDTIYSGLASAMVISEFTGDEGSFKAEQRRLARYLLLGSNSEATDPQALNWLRQSGDTDALRLAANRVVTVGPLGELKSLVDSIETRNWTPSSVRTNLALWKVAGDLMSAASGQAALNLLTNLVSNPNQLIREDFPNDVAYLSSILSTMTGLLPVVPLSAHNELLEALELLLDDPLIFDTAVSASLEELFGWVDWDDVDSDRKGRWLEFALFNSEWSPTPVILARLADFDARAEERLLDLASSGNYFALLKLNNPKSLGFEHARTLLASLEASVDRIVERARQNSWGLGLSLPSILVWLNQSFPEIARWNGIFSLLEEDRVLTSEKRAVCEQLAVNLDVMDEVSKARLTSILEGGLKGLVEPLAGDPDLESPTDLLRAALGTLSSEEQSANFPLLLNSRVRGRRGVVARMLGFSKRLGDLEIGALLALASDTSMAVRAAAVEAVSRQVAGGHRHPALESSVVDALGMDSATIPYATLAGMARLSAPLPLSIVEALESVKDHHLSGKTRRLSGRILVRDLELSQG